MYISYVLTDKVENCPELFAVNSIMFNPHLRFLSWAVNYPQGQLSQKDPEERYTGLL